MGRFGLISLGAHAAVLGAILVATLLTWRPVAVVPDTPASVEMVMVETKGTGQSAAPAPSPAPSPTQQAVARPAAAPPAAPDVPEGAGESPPPAPSQTSQPAAARPPAPAAPAAARQAPVIDLGGADFETNALVSGDRVIPAKPDAHWHNKEPVYPREAADRGQQGAVVVLIHISPEGLMAGADVVSSSGYRALDHAALDAVRDWRFVPAVKDGQPVPSEMAWRVVFQLR